MRIMILAGGRGTRLAGVVDDRPKVLAEVGGKPFLWHLLQGLSRFPVEQVILLTGYRAEQVEEFVQAGSWKFPIECVAEPEPMGTGGALRHVVEQKSAAEGAVVLNGDTWFTGDLLELVQDPKQPTMALVQVPDIARYGAVEHDSGRISQFLEKGATGEGWINAGAYWLPADCLAELPRGPSSLERDAFPRWMAQDRLYAVEYPAVEFLDIGTPADLKKAEARFASPGRD